MPAAVICADSTAAPAADDDTMMRLHMLGFELQRISKWLEWRGCAPSNPWKYCQAPQKLRRSIFS